MNIKEYISTGILEAYALGEVSSAERLEVERNLTQYPELREELEAIEKTMEAFIRKASVVPDPAVKAKIMGQVEATEAKTIVMPSTSMWRYATAASVAIALLTSYMAYHYYDKWAETSFALSDLIAQNQQIAQDYNVVNEKLDKIQNDFSIIENTSFTKVVMRGTENSPQAMASVYWNADTKEVYISIQNLKALSQANQYQLWAIVDGKPVDAGLFDWDIDGLIKMKSISGAAAFAVTIEPKGGKESPTIETMQVMGAIPKS